MINSVMLRDPLNHAMSLYKVMKAKKSTREDWAKHLHEASSPGKWHSVLDFLLYNIQIHRYHDDYPQKIGRNPFNVTKEEKVKRAMQILDTHFDVITIGDHTEFKRQILEMTGWIDMEIPHSNVYKKELECKRFLYFFRFIIYASSMFANLNFLFFSYKKGSRVPTKRAYQEWRH